jgi:hypothetical protein
VEIRRMEVWGQPRQKVRLPSTNKLHVSSQLGWQRAWFIASATLLSRTMGQPPQLQQKCKTLSKK